MDSFIDISPSIDDKLALWPGHPALETSKWMDMATGDIGNVTTIRFCAHTGTHVDASKHFFDDGGGVEEIPMDGLIGKACVADLTHVESGVARDDLAFLSEERDFDILLMKTRNSMRPDAWTRFDENYVYLSPDGARCALENGLKGIAIDSLGINPFHDETQETHKVLLEGNQIAVIEGVDLRNVEPGRYILVCLPIKLAGADGAPARAILIRPEAANLLLQGT